MEATTPGPVLESAWALQTLPDTVNVSAGSPSKLGEAAAQIIASRLKPAFYPAESSSSTPVHWELHTIPATGSPWQAKVPLVASAISKSLSSTAIGKFRIKGRARLQEGDILVQSFMKEAQTLAMSFTKVEKSAFFWRRPIPFHGGVVPFQDTHEYPAASYRKCQEILMQMGVSLENGLDGKSVVELGAMPGGWTMVLLEAGARVHSVDWANLEHPWLTSHAKLTHYCEDAREFDPTISAGLPSADYLFADLALPPSRSLSVLEHWLRSKWTKKFAWAFKFGFQPAGEEYAPFIESVRASMNAIGGGNIVYSIRHLYKQENEIVVIGGWLNP